MDYFVDCACGNRLRVTAALAGSTVRCPCDRVVSVPALSELRQAAGERPFESGIVDTIRRMIAEGSLPQTRECALTGRLTDDVVEVEVECQRLWKRGPKKLGWGCVLSALILPCWPLWLLLGWALLDEKREELGRALVVRIPLRVCRDRQDGLRRMSQRRLRRLLQHVSVYAKLLHEYPGARMWIVRREGE